MRIFRRILVAVLCALLLVGCKGRDEIEVSIAETTDFEKEKQEHLYYYKQLIEETISFEKYIGSHSTSKLSGTRKTGIYYDSIAREVFFFPREEEVAYMLSKYPNYNRYAISMASKQFKESMDKGTLEWLGDIMVNYDAEMYTPVIELSESDLEAVNVLVNHIYEQFSTRQEQFCYDVFLGDFLKGEKDGTTMISMHLAIEGGSSYYIYAELTSVDEGYDIWLYPSPFGLPDTTKVSQESGEYQEVIDNIIAVGYKVGKIKK